MVENVQRDLTQAILCVCACSMAMLVLHTAGVAYAIYCIIAKSACSLKLYDFSKILCRFHSLWELSSVSVAQH